MSETTTAIAPNPPVPSSPPRSARPQLTLWQLLVLMTLVGFGVGSHLWFGWYGLLIWGAALWYFASYYGWLKPGEAEVAWGVLMTAVIVMGPLCNLPRRHVVGEITPSSSCRLNLKQIQLSLLNYHDIHGEYPPITTYSESGRPMHSWRTHLLPFIERQDLAAAYDYAEPWDGPANSRLHREKLKVFSCPNDPGKKSGQVAYLAIVDPQAKPGEPFAVIEVHNSGINYFEPRDVTIAELLSPQSPLARSSRAPHGNNELYQLVLKDGRIERVTVLELQQMLRDGQF